MMKLNRQRITALLALPAAAAAISLALAAPPPGPSSTASPKKRLVAPGPTLDRTYTIDQLEHVRWQLHESIMLAAEVVDIVRPAYALANVPEGLAVVAGFDDQELSKLLSTGIDFDSVHAAMVQAHEMLIAEQAASGPSVADPAGLTPGDFPDAQYSAIWGSQGPHPVAVFIAFNVMSVLETAAQILHRVCAQTSFGFDCNPAVLVLDLPFVAVKIVFELLMEAGDDVTNKEVEASYLRAEHLHEDLLALQDEADAIDTMLNAMLMKLDDLAVASEALRVTSCEHIRLALLPQEQRTSSLPNCPP